MTTPIPQNALLYQTWWVLAAGLKAQALRARVAAQNFVNAESVGSAPEDTPYKRQQIIIRAAQDKETGTIYPEVSKIMDDPRPPRMRYLPGHPAADDNGMVPFPRINRPFELTDFQNAHIVTSGAGQLYKTATSMVAATHQLMRSA